MPMRRVLGCTLGWLLALGSLAQAAVTTQDGQRLSPEEAAGRRMNAILELRFRRFAVRDLDIPHAFLALAVHGGFNCGLELRPEDNLEAAPSAEGPPRVSLDLENVTTAEVVDRLRTLSRGRYQVRWDARWGTLNLVPSTLAGESPESVQTWASTKLPTFSTACACYSEAVTQLLAHPALAEHRLVHVHSGFLYPCEGRDYTFVTELGDPIRLTFSERKGWTAREWLYFIHRQVSLQDGRHLYHWYSQPSPAPEGGQRYRVGVLNAYPLPKGSSIELAGRPAVGQGEGPAAARELFGPRDG